MFLYHIKSQKLALFDLIKIVCNSFYLVIIVFARLKIKKELMLKVQRVKFISNKLNNLYPNPPIPLDHKDIYTLLISVVLSAQCTDKRVNLVTPKLFTLANNPYDMISLGPEEIRNIIKKSKFQSFKNFENSKFPSFKNLRYRIRMQTGPHRPHGPGPGPGRC